MFFGHIHPRSILSCLIICFDVSCFVFYCLIPSLSSFPFRQSAAFFVCFVCLCLSLACAPLSGSFSSFSLVAIWCSSISISPISHLHQAIQSFFSFLPVVLNRNAAVLFYDSCIDTHAHVLICTGYARLMR